MPICGVEIKGSEAIFALANLNANQFVHIPLETKRIALTDDDDSGSVQSFAQLVAGFLRDNEVTSLAIKKRGKKGEFAGGPTTFKIEGILQLIPGCDVQLIAPPTIAAQDRKHKFPLPDSLNKYQHDAFRTACAAIAKGLAKL